MRMATNLMDGASGRAEDLTVLVISHGHPDVSLGGAEVASYNLHKGLKTLPGHRSFYLARVGAPVPRHGETALMSLGKAADEILFHADEYDHFMLSNSNTEDLRRDLRRFVSRLRPDVVHFHHIIGLGLEALYTVRECLPDAAIVVTFHEFLSICHHHGQMVKTGGMKLCEGASPISCHACFPDIPPARFLRRERVVRSMLGLADHFVSPSRFLADRYIDWGIPADRLSVVENGLDIAATADTRPLDPAEGRRGRFAFFGQMTPYKGADVLLDAVGRIPDDVWGEDARLMIFGGNLERQPRDFQESMARSIEKAGTRARFHGAYRNTEMPRLMAGVDWLIVPSVWWENSPVVIQESFFHGRPVIASGIGGMAEKVRDGIDGLHFRVGSAEDLADRMVEALTRPDLWRQLRSGIRRPPTHVDCAREHGALYRSLIDGTAAVTPAEARTA